MKYILVTGGVISGVGKGIIASSIGTIMKSCGLSVTSIKIDPYLNIDAGTFSPYEHGEVFVLDDGGEVDLDLGNYERFLDITLHRDNNITTGKIYQHVIHKERKGDYLGKTVQVVPHVTDAIQEWVERVAQVPVDGEGAKPEICIIELGGTIGDIESMAFVEAFRQFQFRVGQENFCVVHVSLVPQMHATGEQKSKPTQNSVRSLRAQGLSPDLIVCRSVQIIEDSVRGKIAMFCHVQTEQVIGVHDCTSIYRVPLLLERQGIVPFFTKRLHLEVKSPRARRFLAQWHDLAERNDKSYELVRIALVGKYTKLEDSYMSVTKALKHASLYCHRRLEITWIEAEKLEAAAKDSDPVNYHEAWQKLCSCQGILVPGGFGSRGVEGKISAVKWAREKKIPFLGICLGLQSAVIEFARSVVGWTDAHTQEINPSTSHPVIVEMPEHNPGDMGGTMRLGKRRTNFINRDSVLYKLYGRKDAVEERHRHRYEVNPALVEEFESRGMKFVGHDVGGQRMEIMELRDHPYFVAVQYHPEYLSRPMKPSPPYLGLILAAGGSLTRFLSQGCRFSPRSTYGGGSFGELEDDAIDEEVARTLGSTDLSSN